MVIAFLVGVDGGGSGTRVRLSDLEGRELAQGHAGPSALARGIAPAWRAVEAAIDDAFVRAQRPRPEDARLAVGMGVAGANHAPWQQALREAAPAFAALELESDACITLLGVHQGAPGAVVAVGTGSVGMAEDAYGHRRLVGGWGFPAGDEGSGAWMGLRAVAHAQQAQDGRRSGGQLAQAVIDACGPDGLLSWAVAADQQAYASLAPIVVQHAGDDTAARAIVVEAATELGRMALALDPWGELPLAWCGGLAQALWPHLAPDLQRRSRPPRGDAAAGALRLIARRLGLPAAAAATTQAGRAACGR